MKYGHAVSGEPVGLYQEAVESPPHRIILVQAKSEGMKFIMTDMPIL